MPNRLIHETSPYLQQHAHNPVDWYPWGEEALRRAREEDRPILLSIGYSACHWCHVMERESFEDEETARLMNQHFVNIKVDREERPDLDSIYMQAVQTLTGRGGWPLTVFLTPDGKPFYGGTYFPPQDQHGMPGFPRVLQAIAEAYHSQRAQITSSADQLVSHLQQSVHLQPSTDPLQPDLLHQAFRLLETSFDEQHGGFGTAPKFPQPMVLEFLLRYAHRTGNAHALHMVELSLERMAHGGMYDQVGGGFHRYSTDPFWLVPHFEKMLYDNALISRLYLHAYQATGKPLYRRITQETLDYLLREMTDPAGGFYSTQDADSEGIEGKYYIWTTEELRQALGPEEADLVEAYFDVTVIGNFEGGNILHVPRPPEVVAQTVGVKVEHLQEVVGRARQRLLEVRAQRVPTGRDEKVLTSWNGMLLRSLAEAASVLDRRDYREAALSNASFLLERLSPQGRLLRSYKDGQAKVKGYLEDYASLADGLLALYEATFEERWLEGARSLADAMLELFWDEGQGFFYDTGTDHEGLVVRPRDFFDNATPCGGSIATDILLRLALLTGQEEYRRRAASSLRSLQALMSQHPLGFGHWLGALDFSLSTPKEVAIIGPLEEPATQALLGEVYRRYLPNRVLAACDPGNLDGKHDIPLLQDRAMQNGRPTAYVCENYACMMPVTEPSALAEQLQG